MKLWILRPRPDNMGPWIPGHDTNQGFVVRAKDELHARQLAYAVSANEGREAWWNPAFSTCEPLTANGEAGVIIQDYNAA